MNREYTFSPELLQMMLSEERQKFVSALGRGAHWQELTMIRNNITEINKLLDSGNEVNRHRGDSQQRFNNEGLRG